MEKWGPQDEEEPRLVKVAPENALHQEGRKHWDSGLHQSICADQ